MYLGKQKDDSHNRIEDNKTNKPYRQVVKYFMRTSINNYLINKYMDIFECFVYFLII